MRLSRFVPALVLASVALASPLLAQPSEGTRAIAELEVALRLEAIERVVESIASRLERKAPAKAERVRARRSPGEAFAKRHLTSDVEVMLKDLFKTELTNRSLRVADLKFDLMLHRSLRSAYRIRDISDRMPTSTTGFSPPRTRGYPAEVAAIDNRAPHSMGDLADYTADRFTNAALNRIVTEGRTVEIHVGGELEALSDLKNRGFTVKGEVKAPNGNYERLLVAEGPGGEVRYVITGDISGMDRVRHLAALLRFAGPDGRGVANDKIEIVGDVKALEERNYRDLRTGLETVGLRGDRAIIGFRAALKNELAERALARRGAEHLRDALGSNPHEGLMARLEAERSGATGARRANLEKIIEAVSTDGKLMAGMKVQPASVFSKVATLKKLLAAEKALVELNARYPESKILGELVADGKLRLPGGVSAKTYGVTRPIEFGSLRAEEVRVKTSNGVESLKLLNNYYGDTMGTVVRALLDSGHSRLSYFGTAGGTAEGVRVGDVHVPRRVYDFRGELASGGVRNGFLDHFEGRASPLGNRLHLGTDLGNVFSPAEETMRWLENTRSRGIHSVEVENSYVTREVGRFNHSRAPDARATLNTAVIISDVPGSKLTLGNNNSATTATFEKMVDHYLEVMKITDLELVEKDDARRPNRPLARDDHARNALEVADKLVPRARAKSNFLRDRLAGIVSALDPATLAALNASGSSRLKLADVKGLSEADFAALEREVKSPYTDADVLSSLGKGDAVLSKFATRLAKAHPNANYELKVGGGVERGSYSPARGLTVELAGASAEVRATARTLLEAARAEVGGAPEIRFGEAGAKAISFGKGEVFRGQPRPLVREMLTRAMTYLGANNRGTRVEYSGRVHDPAANPSELFSRYETATVGPRASAGILGKFEARVARLGGRVEYVPSSDPRLRGGQGRTLVDAEGRPVVLLPKDQPVRRFALIDELTHVRQIDEMTRKLGRPAVKDLFERARQSDPAAVAKMLEWEIKAKRLVRLTLAQDDPNRALLGREIERLRRVRDPYLDVRSPSGRVNWKKVRAFAKTHAEGSASFLLGLFLKDLARVIKSGDREIISQFFDGLATTEFWKEYGLFVVGAEAGTLAYTRFLGRFVKPSFVSSVLKSNVALATGMALPALVRGQLDGKTFAINFTGLMLSSAAVKAGLAGIKWVMPLGRLSRYKRLSRFLSVARGVPGWIYAGIETAVVLYFAEEISASVNGWLEEREARKDVGAKAAAVLAAARAARSGDDVALQEALDEASISYTRWRDRSLRPAMEATARFNARVEEAGRKATHVGLGTSRFSAIASRYENLTRSVERVGSRNDAEVDRMIDAAVSRFERERAAGLKAAYEEGRRRGRYDPLRDARSVSENRPQAYDDEAALYEAAADVAGSAEAAETLREWARLTREIKERERVLFSPPAPGGAEGAVGTLEAIR